MYDKVTAAQQAGVGLAFLSSDAIYWQVRSEASSDGRPNRVMVCYKNATTDPVKGANATTKWRDLGRPEQRLLGAMYTWALGPDASWVAGGNGGPALAGAQLPPGTVVPNLVGVEADRVVPGYPWPDASHFYVLSNSPFAGRNNPNSRKSYLQQSTLYQSSTSGAWVFDAGTFNWPKALSDSGRGYADGRIATVMANVLGLMLGEHNAATIDRVSGYDRYVTAAAVARYAFPHGATAAYVANGDAFADALTGAPIAGHDRAPILLVAKTGIPSVTANALSRIAPRDIFILGGPAVVPDAIAGQLSRYTRGGRVTRLGGNDRYSTAAKVSQHSFGPGIPTAFVAAGSGYPDAMAAGAAGARLGAPVLLTEPNSLSPATAAELRRLRPGRIVLLGGERAVSQNVQNQLWGYGPVVRASGSDRFQTAATLASITQAPGTAGTVYLANGLSLVDGLTGGPAAGLDGAPLLITDSRGLAPWTAAEIRILNPRRVVTLGGPAAVTAGALGTLSQLFAGTSFRAFGAG
jgi:putative cell wall-binding protein